MAKTKDIEVGEGSSQIISNQLLAFTDVDTLPEGLKYLITASSNGYFFRRTDPLYHITAFTQEVSHTIVHIQAFTV